MTVFVLVGLILFSPIAFLLGRVWGAGPCSNSLIPPFISTGVKPNILIILDNSNSMDEDFYGNAVGSYLVLPTVGAIIQQVGDRQAGASKPGDRTPEQGDGRDYVISLANIWRGQQLRFQSCSYIHNALPFASYNPNSYCANPPPECTHTASRRTPRRKASARRHAPALRRASHPYQLDQAQEVSRRHNHPHYPVQPTRQYKSEILRSNIPQNPQDAEPEGHEQPHIL